MTPVRATAAMLVGYPTIKAIELLFGDQGFMCTYYNWHDSSTKDWTALTDYGLKERVTFVARRKADTPWSPQESPFCRRGRASAEQRPRTGSVALSR